MKSKGRNGGTNGSTSISFNQCVLYFFASKFFSYRIRGWTLWRSVCTLYHNHLDVFRSLHCHVPQTSPLCFTRSSDKRGTRITRSRQTDRLPTYSSDPSPLSLFILIRNGNVDSPGQINPHSTRPIFIMSSLHVVATADQFFLTAWGWICNIIRNFAQFFKPSKPFAMLPQFPHVSLREPAHAQDRVLERAHQCKYFAPRLVELSSILSQQLFPTSRTVPQKALSCPCTPSLKAKIPSYAGSSSPPM